MEWLASSFAECIGSGTNVKSSAPTSHALQYEALIRLYDSRWLIVSQYITLKHRDPQNWYVNIYIYVISLSDVVLEIIGNVAKGENISWKYYVHVKSRCIHLCLSSRSLASSSFSLFSFKSKVHGGCGLTIVSSLDVRRFHQPLALLTVTNLKVQVLCFFDHKILYWRV